jgi:hypothetical protein
VRLQSLAGRDVEPATRERYRDSLQRLDVWLRSSAAADGVVGLAELDVRAVNTILCEYVDFLYTTGGLRMHAVEGLLALTHQAFWLQGQLKPAWKMVKAWEHDEPVEVRRPIPPVVLRAVLVVLLHWQMPRLATGVWMGFHGLLRPGEIFAAQREDVTFGIDVDGDEQLPPCAVLTIRNPKTRRRGARRQHVLLTDPLLLQLMERCWRDRDARERLLPYSAATARVRLQQALYRLGVPSGVYTWASLRGGGASFEYLLGRPIAAIKFRGRWAAERSLEHYIQECLTFLDMSRLPAPARDHIHQVAKLLPQMLGQEV